MTIKSLGNPYDETSRLTHTATCTCEDCQSKSLLLTNSQRTEALERQADKMVVDTNIKDESQFDTADDMMDRVIENAIVRGVFGQHDASRRNFIKMMGGGTLAAVLGTMIPMDKVKAAVKDSIGKLEKTKLKVGFVPITCATPIIMAKPMGFYA